MEIPKRDSDEMIRLAQEGKMISKIVSENYPQYTYEQVRNTVYNSGQRSALGTKRMITNRLNLLPTANKATRELLVEELHELVDLLYTNNKVNQERLDKIRDLINN